MRGVVLAALIAAFSSDAAWGQDAPRPGDVTGLTLESVGSSARLRIDVTGVKRATWLQLDQPPRVVVDLHGARHALPARSFATDGRGGVLQIRTSQFDASVVRIVLDLERMLGFDVRSDADGVVVDLEGTGVDFVAWEIGTAAQPVRAPAPSAPAPSAPPTALTGSSPVFARITQIAGSTLYVGVGEDHGIHTGDTVSVGFDGEDGTPMVVLSASAVRSVLAFLHDPSPATRGDSVRVQPVALEAPRTPHAVAPSSDSVAATRASAPAWPFAVPRVHGRVTTDLSARQAWTGSDGPFTSRERAWVVPTSRLHLVAAGLPGGVVLESRLRASWRYAGSGSVTPSRSIRVYELGLEKRFEDVPLALRIGRLPAPPGSFGGYVDGLQMRVGSPSAGVGGVLGFAPERWNEAFSTERVRASVFAEMRRRLGPVRTASVVSMHTVRPGVGSPDGHTWLGWSQRIRGSGWWVSGALQLDRIPRAARWSVGELLVQGSTRLPAGFRVRGRWSRRAPFLPWRSEPLAYRRDDLGGGLTWEWSGGSLFADVQAHRSDLAPGRRMTHSGGVRLRSLGVAQLSGGITLLDGEWVGLRSRSVLLEAGRPLGRGFARAGYRLTRNEMALGSTVVHDVSLRNALPLGPHMRTNVALSLRLGGGLTATGMQLGLARSF